MTQAQVRAALGPPRAGDEPYMDATHAVVRTAAAGRPEREEYGPPWKVYWLRPSGVAADRWGFGPAVGFICYPSRGWVTETVWLEDRRTIIQRLRVQLGF